MFRFLRKMFSFDYEDKMANLSNNVVFHSSASNQSRYKSESTSWRRTDENHEMSEDYGYEKSNWRTTRSNEDFKTSKEKSLNRVNKTYLTVSGNKVGKIIGKQGSNIKELESSTGAKILIGKEEDYDGNVKVTIIGDSAAQEKCKTRIEKQLYGRVGCILNALDSENRKPVTVIDWDAVNKASEEYEKKKWAEYPPLKKNFYFEDPFVASMDENYVKRLRASMNNIMVSGAFKSDQKIPNPVETFEQAFGAYSEIMDEILKQQFTKPFPIQCQAWPILLSGKDMIGIAQTGTGKTLAFLLPALIHTDGQPIPLSQRGGPNVLILAPTRELALQIEKEVQKYSYRNIKSICVYGGGNRREQVSGIGKGVQIIIATPGRLNDLVEADIINVSSITYVVLDEADRMLDMGFEPQIQKVLLDIRPDKQIIMTSATWPYGVQNLAKKYMKDPIQVVVGSLDLAAVHSVKQTVLIVDDEEKFNLLLEIIYDLTKDDKIIVFVDKKILADGLSCDLLLQGIDCQCIHGNREQMDREQAIEDLKTGAVRILIATDVASRGIDILDVTKVLNYDFPRNIEEYVHRVGRTGRAGKTGEAITFFTRNDWGHAKELIPILEEANQIVPQELHDMKRRFDARQERRRNDGVSTRENRGKYNRFDSYNDRFQSRRSK